LVSHMRGKHRLMACGNGVLRKMFVRKLDGMAGDCIVTGYRV